MYCERPLIKINEFDKNIQLRLERTGHRGQIFFSWKWYPLKKSLNRDLLNDRCYVYPCKNCISCLNMNRYHWVKKLELEKPNWQNTYFITITYNNENVPNQLVVNDIQKFIKMLRKYIKDFKYFVCGEYGSKSYRPHYHMILFTNYELQLLHLKNTNNGPLYDCKLLNKCWLYKGFIWVAYDFDSASFAYVATYSNKNYIKSNQNKLLKEFKEKLYILKQNYESNFIMYCEIDRLFNAIWYKKPEFIIMSKKPPIASGVESVSSPSSLLKWFVKNNITPQKFEKELQNRKNKYYDYLKYNDLEEVIYNNEINKFAKNEKNTNMKKIL